jgi:hypothetical protein
VIHLDNSDPSVLPAPALPSGDGHLLTLSLVELATLHNCPRHAGEFVICTTCYAAGIVPVSLSYLVTLYLPQSVHCLGLTYLLLHV